MTTHAACGCPQHPGRTINDVAKHAAWHALVVEQGGPAGDVNVETLRVARGAELDALRGDAGRDVKARKRAFTELRRRAIAVLS